MSKKTFERELLGTILDLKKLVAGDMEMAIGKSAVFIKVEKIIWDRPNNRTIPVKLNIFANKIPYNNDLATVVKIEPVEMRGIALHNLYRGVMKEFIGKYSFEKGA